MRVALAYNIKRSAAEEEAEFDTPETIDAIRGAIASLGHAVVDVEVSRPVPELAARLLGARPDLVFNLAEGRRGKFREAFYPALFEQLSLPYTGSDAGALSLAMDKALTNKLLSGAAGVVTPRSLFIGDAGALTRLPERAAELSFPLIVKPNYEGSSKGITQKSVVEDGPELMSVAAGLLRRYPEGLIVEEFIDGLDVSVPWVDGLSPETDGVLAPAVYWYRPTGRYRIYDLRLKRTGQALVEARVPADFGAGLLSRLGEVSRRIFCALGITGYGRADFRVTPGGGIYFIEMNPLPSLSPGPDAELYKAAALLGKSPADVFACIIDAATRRFGLN
jgi:D-alanine-D-alanine ligase